jgi:hypothetical protein
MNKNHGFNEFYFQDIDSDDKAYCLGFIAADGCIGSKYHLQITLAKKDIAILRKIQRHLECRKSVIKRYERDTKVGLCVSSQKIVIDLIDKGVTPRKSLTLCNVLDWIPDCHAGAFITGYFDGDGSVGIYEYMNKNGITKIRRLQVAICGTKETLRGICDYIKVSYKRILNLDTLKKNRNIFSLRLQSREEITQFYSLTLEKYLDSMPRKRRIFGKVLAYIDKMKDNTRGRREFYGKKLAAKTGIVLPG